MIAEIDFRRLYNLTGADRKIYCQIIYKYIEILPDSIRDLTSSLAVQNVEATLIVLHDLKGSLSVLNILPEEISYDELHSKVSTEGFTEENKKLIQHFILKLQHSIQSLRIEQQIYCPL